MDQSLPVEGLHNCRPKSRLVAVLSPSIQLVQLRFAAGRIEKHESLIASRQARVEAQQPARDPMTTSTPEQISSRWIFHSLSGRTHIGKFP